MSVSEPLIQSILVGDALDHGPVAVLVADEEMQYVAVNTFACELFGYTREELLKMRITDIARYPEAPAEFDLMVASRELEGLTTIVCKDGTELTMRYRAGETRIAGLAYYVSVCWPES